MRLLDREILRCEGKIPQLAPSAQLRGKLLYNVSLRASESSECFGDSEGARLGKVHFHQFVLFGPIAWKLAFHLVSKSSVSPESLLGDQQNFSILSALLQQILAHRDHEHQE